VSRQIAVMHAAVKQFHQAFGVYPEGGNLEVAKALMGENPTKTVFLELPQKQVARSGELLDPYETPYQISVTAEGKLDIRSAGKDRLFWNADDEVLKP
jgi:hypothetical protein